MQQSKTERGFDFYEFNDRYGAKCSLQKSSLATEDAIWFGVNDADPKIMCSDGLRLGLTSEVKNGWMEYEIPKEVEMTTRMHLTRKQVKELIPILQKFAKTGNIV